MPDEQVARTFSAIRIGPQPAPPRRYEAGRTCAADGCLTVLSVYTPGPACWAHEEPHAFWNHSRARRKRAA